MGRPAPEGIRIIDATIGDAPLIARAIMEAVGPEIVNGMAGENGSADDVFGVFTRLARRDDSQYSYLNTRIALAPDGQKAGVCVSYSGKELIPLRRAFFNEARQVFGWQLTPEEVDSLPGETTPEEFYLDTLSTLPKYRGQGIATALIADAKLKADQCGLPLGLLCADDNPRARKLYESIGFQPVGRRLFAGEEMTNMRLIE
ncbi:MAG: GNAT family N-acetyltransferase [Bacteroides sp.]|nr:GNAT family N-acetyltransferase [Bacteroides sp.]